MTDYSAQKAKSDCFEYGIAQGCDDACPGFCREYPEEGCETLGYLQAHFDAERRIKRGERQVFCKTCQKWRWPDELCEYAEVDHA